MVAIKIKCLDESIVFYSATIVEKLKVVKDINTIKGEALQIDLVDGTQLYLDVITSNGTSLATAISDAYVYNNILYLIQQQEIEYKDSKWLNCK